MHSDRRSSGPHLALGRGEAGARSWKQLDEPEPRAFRSPSRNIRCEMRDDSYVRGVECVYGKDEIRAMLSPRGRVRACEGAESTCTVAETGNGFVIDNTGVQRVGA